MEQYYLIALSLTHTSDAFITLVRSGLVGYCWNKNEAHLATKNQTYQCSRSKGMIAVRKSYLDAHFITVHFNCSYINVLPNTTQVRRAICTSISELKRPTPSAGCMTTKQLLTFLKNKKQQS